MGMLVNLDSAAISNHPNIYISSVYNGCGGMGMLVDMDSATILNHPMTTGA